MTPTQEIEMERAIAARLSRVRHYKWYLSVDDNDIRIKEENGTLIRLNHDRPGNIYKANFIANAPTDIVYLLGKIERLQKEHDALLEVANLGLAENKSLSEEVDRRFVLIGNLETENAKLKSEIERLTDAIDANEEHLDWIRHKPDRAPKMDGSERMVAWQVKGTTGSVMVKATFAEALQALAEKVKF